MSFRTAATKPLTLWLAAWGSWGALYGFCLLILLFLAAPIVLVIVTLLMSPLIFPSIITGIALLQFFSMLGISAAFFTLTIGHTIITLPYVVRNVIASLQSTRGNVEEAARVLGASAWQAFIRVTLPLIKPGLLAGGICQNQAASPSCEPLGVGDAIHLSWRSEYTLMLEHDTVPGDIVAGKESA